MKKPLLAKSGKKRSMVLNLTEPEMAIIERLAIEKGVTKTGLVRQAIRLYDSFETRMREGHKLYIEDSDSKEKSELLIL